MKKSQQLVLKIFIVFALLFTSFSNVVFASGNEIKIQFTPNQQDMDKEWKVHMWIPGTDKVYPNNVLTKNNDIFETTIQTVSTKEVGYVIYYGDWQKDLGSKDRSAVVDTYSTIKVRQGEEQTQVVNEETSELIVHFKKDENHKQHTFNIWTWYDGENGKQVDFSESDDYGQIARIRVRGRTLNQIGLKVRSSADTNNDWELQSNSNLDVALNQGKAEIWVDGLSADYKTSLTPTTTNKLTNITLTVNYLRTDNDYSVWNTWTWLRNNGIDSDSKATQFNNKKAVIHYEKQSGIDKVGLIVRKSLPGSEWAGKNTEQDLIISDFPQNGEKEIWIVENDPTVYYSFDEIPSKIVSAVLNDDNTITLSLSKPVTEAIIQNIVVENYTVVSRQIDVDNHQKVVLTLDKPVVKSNDVVIKDNVLGTFTIPLKFGYLHSKEFNEQNYYDGELGAIYTPEKTTFKLWAPTAKTVQLVDYTQTGNNFVVGELTNQENHWSITLNKDTLGMKYRYRVTFYDGTMREFVDPYAKATTANGVHTVVIDSKNTVPTNWSNTRMPAFLDQSKAIIYEAHIRDLTISPNNGITNKGKFLGLTEENTKTLLNNPSGLAYLKSLGVTHVQFLPMYDFDSVDETNDLSFNAQYNWGYDPLHYNVPEGSYSTDPQDPTARVKEMKQMIQALHDNGIRVIMDVVYNHVYNTERSPLHQSVPGYFFRYDNKGKLHNGTGVGNETASEQKMFRKYMIDSLKYWASEYNIDGFRFDLMGIHDVETMNEIRTELNKIDPSIVILGEGWNMGNHPENVMKAHQYNAEHMPNIAFFNDVFRDAVKGDNFTASNPGYVNHANNQDFGWKILNSIKSQYVVPYKAINQNVLYNEAHDNYTLYDKLKQSTNVDEDTIVRMHTHATTLQALGYGLMFVHAGQENLRTKVNDHNSYKSPDSVNAFDYDRAQTYQKAHQYFKDLLTLRKTESLFNLNSFDEINQKVSHMDGFVDGNKIVYKVEADETYYVISNASNQMLTVPLPQAEYEILVADMKVYLNEAERERSEATDVSVEPNSVMILKKVEYANYTEVDKALQRVENYNPAHYTNYDSVATAINNIVRNLRKSNQQQVDTMAQNLNSALDGLQRKASFDYVIGDVTVSLIDGNIPEFERVEVIKLDKATPNYDKANSDVYEVRVYNSKTSEYVPFRGNAKLVLPTQANKEVAQAYYIEGNNKEVIPFEVVNNKAILSVKHFSEYGIEYLIARNGSTNVVVEKEEAVIEKVGDSVNISKETAEIKKLENTFSKQDVDTSDNAIIYVFMLLVSAIFLICRKMK